ncbi:Protein ChrB [Burkholderiales bacterium]|nr:Protein ChrB [Burkholderiales bacterium]
MDAVRNDPPSTSCSISIARFRALRESFPPPQVLDVRRAPAFERDPVVIPGSVRCAPQDVRALAATLEPWRPVVSVCVHGHEVSEEAAATLAAAGYDARALDGGIEQWRAEGGSVVAWRAPSRWVTRERPKIDRIACPWLVRRFVDPAARFFYVPNAEVRAFAAANGATPYDIPDVDYSHRGAECSFDAFIRLHGLDDPALAALAAIVRGADTGALDLAAEAPGLLAVSLGLSRVFADDDAMLRFGMLVYDALYARCRDAAGESHGWNPDSLRVAAAAA